VLARSLPSRKGPSLKHRKRRDLGGDKEGEEAEEQHPEHCHADACHSDQGSPSTGTKTFMKGWRLHIWQQGNDTYYSLVPGTN
jgi:hypothetical protein